MKEYRFWVLLFLRDSTSQNLYFQFNAVTESTAIVFLWEKLLPVIARLSIKRMTINNCLESTEGCCDPDNHLEDCVGLPIRN